MSPSVLVYHNAPSSTQTTYTFQCRACPNVETQTYMGNSLLLPNHPGPGWREITAGKWICPKHQVKLMVDGEERPL